jgi:hypothetical protein
VLSSDAVENKTGAWVHVKLEMLIENALFEPIPELVIHNDDPWNSLYSHKVGLRITTHYHSGATDMTKYKMLLCYRLAKFF